MKTGDHVTYHFWHQGELRTYDAVVTGVFPAEKDASQALALEVAFEESVIESGIITSQSCARQRTRTEDDIHTSGTWSPLS